MAHKCGRGLADREAQMNFRDILVFLDESSASEGRLHLATKITRDHGACLNAVFLRKRPCDQIATAPCFAVACNGRGAAASRRDR